MGRNIYVYAFEIFQKKEGKEQENKTEGQTENNGHKANISIFTLNEMWKTLQLLGINGQKGYVILFHYGQRT